MPACREGSRGYPCHFEGVRPASAENLGKHVAWHGSCADLGHTADAAAAE